MSDSDLITIAGGKWTTYRAMAEETVDTAVQVFLSFSGSNPETFVRVPVKLLVRKEPDTGIFHSFFLFSFYSVLHSI